MAEKTAVELLEEQKKRYEKLVARRGALQGELTAAQRQFKEAEEEALREFGTANLDELRALLKQRQAENDQKTMEFMDVLDACEEQLKAIEQLVGA